MKIELIIQSYDNKRAIDVSQLTTSITWSTDILDQPSKLEIDILKDQAVLIAEGDFIIFKYEGVGLFKGKIFKKKKAKDEWSITALGNERYLGNEDTMVFGASSSDQRFTNICKANGIPYKVVNKSGFKVQPAIYDGKSFYSMMEESFTHTLINSGMWYILRDKFGTLEHIALNSLITSFVIGDKSLLTDFDFESSIEDSYNVIKLVKDNEESNRREVYIVKDSNLEKRWGTLQYFQKVDDDLNPAQIKEMANNMAKSMAKAKRKLKVDALGIKELQAGHSVVLQLEDLAHEKYNRPTLSVIEKCTHTFDKVHTMSLEMRVI